MYWNIGGTIKKVALFIGYSGITISLLVSFIYLLKFLDFKYDPYLEILITALISALLFWIGHLFIYGFGELIETTIQINKNIKSISDKDKEKKTDWLKTASD